MMVVHCKQAHYDIYIGRPTKWGNPFVLTNERDRDAVVDQYRKWLMTKPELIAAARKELNGKILGCWCAPRSCHGDVLAKVAEGEDP